MLKINEGKPVLLSLFFSFKRENWVNGWSFVAEPKANAHALVYMWVYAWFSRTAKPFDVEQTSDSTFNFWSHVIPCAIPLSVNMLSTILVYPFFTFVTSSRGDECLSQVRHQFRLTVDQCIQNACEKILFLMSGFGATLETETFLLSNVLRRRGTLNKLEPSSRKFYFVNKSLELPCVITVMRTFTPFVGRDYCSPFEIRIKTGKQQQQISQLTERACFWNWCCSETGVCPLYRSSSCTFQTCGPLLVQMYLLLSPCLSFGWWEGKWLWHFDLLPCLLV